MKSCDLFIVKRKKKLRLNLTVTNDVKKADTYVVNSVFTVKHCRNGKSCIYRSVEEALAKVANGNCNSIECCTLALDNLTAGLTYVINHLVAVEIRILNAGISNGLAVILYGDVGNVSDGPGNECCIAVLTEDVCVNVVLADLVVLSDSCTKTCSIEDST